MPSDWRLTNQEKYLKGHRLTLKPWTRTRPDWDHDHCEFCWAKFTDTNSPNALHEGYATEDNDHWVCKPCFEDFKTSFGWTS